MDFKDVKILLEEKKVSEIDGTFPQFTLKGMKALLVMAWLGSGWVMAQTATESSIPGLSDLPSAEAKPKIPGLDEPAPSPDLSGVTPAESPSNPQLRPPAADPAKTKAADDSDWAAKAMLQKKEEARKKQEEEALAGQKAQEETRKKIDQEKKEKEQKQKSGGQPVVGGAAVPGLSVTDAQKLPVVTGLEGVKPRGMASGDGRVQPGFDSFTGPASTGPLGQDFQSGAKPIMPVASAADGRMQVPLQAPEPPSGNYKRISQDPNTFPPGYGEKKAAPAPVAKTPPKNPPAGNPLTPGNPAGLSPYDNLKKVPDPRSQRRF